MRPRNGRSCTEPQRRIHSMQYFSYPGYTFAYFRERGISSYEAQADIEMDEWVHLKAEVSGAEGRFFVDDMGTPALAVPGLFAGAEARGGAGLVVSSQAGWMGHFSEDEENALALTPTDELRDLPMLQPDVVTGSGKAYIVAKRANHLRVRTAAATTWAASHARVNTISPGIVMTPVAYDEFNAPGNTYQHMIEAGACQRVASPDEIAAAAEFLLSAPFVTGTDLLIDGGTIAAMKSGAYEGRRDRR